MRYRAISSVALCLLGLACARYTYVSDAESPECRAYRAGRERHQAAEDSAARAEGARVVLLDSVRLPAPARALSTEGPAADGYCSGYGVRRVRKPWWRIW